MDGREDVLHILQNIQKPSFNRTGHQSKSALQRTPGPGFNCHNLGIDQQLSHGLGTADRLRSESGRMEKSSSCWSSILKVLVSDGLVPVFHRVIGQHSLSGDCGALSLRLQSSFIETLVSSSSSRLEGLVPGHTASTIPEFDWLVNWSNLNP